MMSNFGIAKHLLCIAVLLFLSFSARAEADSASAQNTLRSLVARFDRSEIGRIELFWEDLTDLTQVGISPRHFAALKTSPHLLDDPGFAEAFHKTYVDTANKLLRSEIDSAVRSMDTTPLSPSTPADIRMSITFYDRNDSEIATLFFSYDGANGAVNFNDVIFNRNELFELLKKQYVDPQEMRIRKRE